MNPKLLHWSQRYLVALRRHLKQGKQASLESARALGRQALTAGLQTLDLAKIHEHALITELLLSCTARQRAVYTKQAGVFFAVAITPVEETHHDGQRMTSHLRELVMMSQRTVELAGCNLALSLEITEHQAVEEALQKKERHYKQVLKESARLHEQLRQLSRQVLSAQEAERKAISRELHDIVAQTLTAINVRLAALKHTSSHAAADLIQNIARTQRLIEQSVDIVHRFARELRPAVLDDLGLIPALHSFLTHFTERTGVRTRLTASAEVERTNIVKRTVLFRVAQEALTNAARHAQASQVEVTVRKLPDGIRMTIGDDGKSFQVQRVLMARGSKRLGLLGMRERLEMVGGRLEVESSPGTGTMITAWIPFPKVRAPQSAKPLVVTSTTKP